MRSTIVSIVLLHAVMSFGQDVEKGSDGKLEPLENIYSKHLPRHLPTLKLTTGELKQFAGHSFQLVMSKCPAVPKDNLNQINKYISKLISKTNPSPGKTKAFTDLVSSMSSCAQTIKPTPEPAEKDQPSPFWHMIFSPFRSIFGSHFDEDDDVDDYVFSSTDKSVDISPFSADDDDDTIAALHFPEESEDASSTAPPPKDSSPFAPTMSSGEAELKRGSDYATKVVPGFTWVNKMITNVHDFLARFFGESGGDLNTSPSIRTKRSTLPETKMESDHEKSADAIPMLQISFDADDDLGMLPMFAYPDPDIMKASATSAVAGQPRGRTAFLALVDHICRIYCTECSPKDQIINFKSAAKELLQLVYADTTGIELAAKHYLDPEVIRSLADC